MDQVSYINAAFEVLDQLFADSPKVTAAMLGAALKDRDLDWTNYGFAKLKDVLFALSATHPISFGPDEKDALAVWRSGPGISTTARAQDRALSTKSLKKPVWTAFVSESVSPPRAIDRRTGTVWLSTSEPPKENGEWMTVDPIPREKQIDWACAFVESNASDHKDSLLHSLKHEEWFREFPRRLEALSQDLRRSWNRERTDRVGEWVASWCLQHSVSPHLLFDIRTPSSRSTPAVPEGRDRLREALLAAVQDLSTEQLLELQLPAESLVKALRPDLLR